MPADNRNQMRYYLSRCYPFDPVSPLPDMSDVQSWNYNALNKLNKAPQTPSRKAPDNTPAKSSRPASL